jgi:pentose-5-phosphate-3-epimerase
VDGGITADTTAAAVRAGANVLVAATAVFADPRGPAAAVRALLAAADAP